MSDALLLLFCCSNLLIFKNLDLETQTYLKSCSFCSKVWACLVAGTLKYRVPAGRILVSTLFDFGTNL